jgi:Uma2 family endonuclease
MPKTALKIGPDDQGRRMSLEEFDQAEGQEGYLYELGRGVISVMDVPNKRHLAQVDATRMQFYAYRLVDPGRIHRIASGSECKILLAKLDSERHPDLAIYRFPPPEGEDIWAVWIPDIVIEVVSLGSEYRDYVEKREEYLQFGIREYWIIDAQREEMRVLRRRGEKWHERTIRPPEVYRPRSLPGLEFDVARVFEAARASDD